MKLSNMVKYERGIDVLLLALICDEKDDQVSKYIIQFIQGIRYLICLLALLVVFC